MATDFDEINVNLRTLFPEGAVEGDVDALNKLCRQVGTFELESWMTLIRGAVSCGHLACVKMLLKHRPKNFDLKSALLSFLIETLTRTENKQTIKDFVELFIRLGVDVNGEMIDGTPEGPVGKSPLAAAAAAGDWPLFEYLSYKKGAIPTKKLTGTTLFFPIALGGSVEILNSVIGLFTNDEINALAADGQTALEVAIESQHLPMVRALIKAGAKIELGAIISQAVRRDNPSILGEVLSAFKIQNESALLKILNTEKLGNNSLLAYAVASRPIESVRLLVEAGCDINSGSPTPLMMALSIKHIPKIKYLLSFDHIDVNRGAEDREHNMTYPLMRAGVLGDVGIMQTLLQKKADVLQRDKNGSAALSWAIAFNFPDIPLLLEHNNINDRSNNGISPIMVACVYKKIASLRLLLQRDAELTQADIFDVLAFLKAKLKIEINLKDTDEVFLILTERLAAFLNRKDAEPDILQFIAATFDLIIANTISLEAGWSVVSNEFFLPQLKALLSGKQAHEIFFRIVESGNVALLEKLIEQGFDPNLQYAEGRSLLSAASMAGQRQVLEFLFKGKIDKEAAERALVDAVHAGQITVAKFLVAKGYGLRTDENEQSVLMLAIELGEGSIAKYVFKAKMIKAIRESKGNEFLEAEANKKLSGLINDFCNALMGYNPQLDCLDTLTIGINKHVKKQKKKKKTTITLLNSVDKDPENLLSVSFPIMQQVLLTIFEQQSKTIKDTAVAAGTFDLSRLGTLLWEAVQGPKEIKDKQEALVVGLTVAAAVVNPVEMLETIESISVDLEGIIHGRKLFLESTLAPRTKLGQRTVEERLLGNKRAEERLKDLRVDALKLAHSAVPTQATLRELASIQEELQKMQAELSSLKGAEDTILAGYMASFNEERVLEEAEAKEKAALAKEKAEFEQKQKEEEERARAKDAKRRREYKEAAEKAKQQRQAAAAAAATATAGPGVPGEARLSSLTDNLAVRTEPERKATLEGRGFRKSRNYHAEGV